MKTAVLPSIPAPLDYPGRPRALVFTAIGLGLGWRSRSSKARSRNKIR